MMGRWAGSLLIMKQFAVALSQGIWIDTFIVRPLLVPTIFLRMSKARSAGNQRAIGTHPGM